MSAASDVILNRLMTLHPKIIDLTLDRMWRLLDALGNPQDDLPPVIHIAGTNGKGSTQAMIRAGLEAAGHSVHAYTSPHLVRFHERIRVAGSLISEAALTDILDECEAANAGAPITYFEITTCAALLAFSRTKADFTLMEVGLGGRLDATNVVAKPRLTVITPVSMDHEAFLGGALADIAREKAGIIKRRVPLIVGRQSDAGLEVIERAAERQLAPVQIFGQHWHAAAERDGMIYQDERGLLDLPRPNLPGDHQIENAGIALNALRALGCDAAACEAGVTRAEWPGRMQRLDLPGEVWLDGGHNPAAGEAIAQLLRAMPERPTHMICGMLNTKSPAGYLQHFSGLIEEIVAVSIPGEAATLSAAETAEAARSVGLKAAEAKTVMTALDDIRRRAPEARIVICGSLYLAGAVLRSLSN